MTFEGSSEKPSAHSEASGSGWTHQLLHAALLQVHIQKRLGADFIHLVLQHKPLRTVKEACRPRPSRRPAPRPTAR